MKNDFCYFFRIYITHKVVLYVDRQRGTILLDKEGNFIDVIY